MANEAPQPVPPVIPPSESPAPPAVPAEAPKPDISAQLAARELQLNKQHKHLANERQKLAAERKAQAAQTQEFEQWKQIQADKRRNPDKYLRADYGENYYDLITKLKVEGSPPADLIASELDERTKALKAEFDARVAEQDKKLSDFQAQQLRSAKQEHLASAVAHVQSNPEKYKLLHAFKEEVPFSAIAQEIEAHFQATTKERADGTFEPGEVWTGEQAAQAIEKRMSATVERVKKYLDAQQIAQPKADKPKGSSTDFTQFKRTDSTQRREGSTATPAEGEWTPPKTEKERWARALAAGDAHLAAKAAQH